MISLKGMHTTDVIVLGLGAMGSSTAYALAKRGRSVIGLEQFSPRHAQGSSHGATRLIRKAYFEHPAYVPLLDLSYELWDELSAKAGRTLFHRTGLVIYGGPESNILKGIRRSAAEFKIPTEELDQAESARRFPAFQLREGDRGIYEPDAGYLEVEPALEAFQTQATALGAQLNFEERVQHWEGDEHGVLVETDKRTYRARKLVITAGPWAGKVLASLGLPLAVHRVPYFWFEAPDSSLESEGFPCFAYDLPEGFFYGFSALPERGLKVAWHRPQGLTDPDGVRIPVQTKDAEPLYRFLNAHLRAIPTPAIDSGLCLYTMTPDENFILDTHPNSRHVLLAAGFSGHGFKFASAIGEVLARRLSGEPDGADLDFLRLRFGK